MSGDRNEAHGADCDLPLRRLTELVTCRGHSRDMVAGIGSRTSQVRNIRCITNNSSEVPRGWIRGWTVARRPPHHPAPLHPQPQGPKTPWPGCGVSSRITSHALAPSPSCDRDHDPCNATLHGMPHNGVNRSRHWQKSRERWGWSGQSIGSETGQVPSLAYGPFYTYS